MAILASDWLRHFWFSPLKPLNGIQRNFAGSKISTSSTKFVFLSGRSEKKHGHPGLWLAERFSTSSFKSLNGLLPGTWSHPWFSGVRECPPWCSIVIATGTVHQFFCILHSTKLDRKQDLTVLYQVCFVGPIGRTGLPPRRLFGRYIFDIFSYTIERNSTKLDRKQDRYVLCQVCFSRSSEKQDGRPGLWFFETFSTSPLKMLNVIQRNLTGSKISMPSTKLVLFWQIGKTRWPTWPLIGWEIFDFSSESLNGLFFRVDRHNKMATQPLIGKGIFDFFSETAERNSTKLDRTQDLNVLSQVCVFRVDRRSEKQHGIIGLWLADTFSTSSLTPVDRIQRNVTGSRPLPSLCFWVDRKNKMTVLASFWPRHFRLLIWNRWTEFNETWQEARSLRPLPSLCFSRSSEKQDGRPGLWFFETFSTSPLKMLNGVQRNLTGSKISMPSTKFVLFWQIGKTRWPTWPLIGWEIFDFSSESLNGLVFFSGRSTQQDGRPASDWQRHFWLLLWNRWAEFNEAWPDARSQRPQPSLCFSRRSSIGKTTWHNWPLIVWYIFNFFSDTGGQDSAKRYGKQDLNVLYQVCVFMVDRKNKMAVLASFWPRHFRLLIWNRWTEFNETWQEARSQRLLPSLWGF